MESKKDLDIEPKELVWGPGWLTEGKQYIVETYDLDRVTGRYKGTTKSQNYIFLMLFYMMLYNIIW